jgi:hypothetical protein
MNPSSNLKLKPNSVAVVRERICRSSDRRLLAKYCQLLRIEGVAGSAQRIPTVVNLDFLDLSRYFFFQVAPELSSRGWVDPVPDPLLLRKSGSAVNRTRDLWICSQKLWPLDHRGCTSSNLLSVNVRIKWYNTTVLSNLVPVLRRWRSVVMGRFSNVSKKLPVYILKAKRLNSDLTL